MSNRGSVTIFLTGIVMVVLILILAVINVIDINISKGNGAMAVRSAISSVKADYNSYVFENYHILIFDKTYYGRGEGYIEEKMCNDIQDNLGDEYVVSDVVVFDYIDIVDDNYTELKKQIEEHMTYAAVEYGVEEVLSETNGEDGALTDLQKRQLESADEISTESQVISSENENHITYDNTDITVEDPRDVGDAFNQSGLLYLIAPIDMEISSEEIDISGGPSYEAGLFSIEFCPDTDFDDEDVLKDNMTAEGEWGESLYSAGAGVAYSLLEFNNSLNEVKSDTVFAFEAEYLICGKNSDYKNLRGVINRISLIRLPINYTYLLTDAAKMSTVASIAFSLTAGIPGLYNVTKYLLAGCWAYTESLADVRCLLAGEKVPFVKSYYTWQTDINNLLACFDETPKQYESGLSYNSYLIILLAIEGDKIYSRMLDIIELNAQQQNPDFEINYACTGFSVSCEISYKNYINTYKMKAEY